MQICVYGASSATLDASYLEAGRRLGRVLAQRGHSLVFGGGDSGLMGAVARGVKELGGRITGVAPRFFHVDGKLYAQCDELIATETMRERKQCMEDLADAFVMTPGGIGTFEEFFEILTLRQLGRHQKAIAVLNTNGYFSETLQMLNRAAREHFMTPACNELYRVFDEPEELVPYLEDYAPLAAQTYKEVEE